MGSLPRGGESLHLWMCWGPRHLGAPNPAQQQEWPWDRGDMGASSLPSAKDQLDGAGELPSAGAHFFRGGGRAGGSPDTPPLRFGPPRACGQVISDSSAFVASYGPHLSQADTSPRMALGQALELRVSTLA